MDNLPDYPYLGRNAISRRIENANLLTVSGLTLLAILMLHGLGAW